MVIKKRLFIVMVVLIVLFASVLFAFLTNNDSTHTYKGTLVQTEGQEVVV
jgi:hypothetical protein